jgi:hypothetical protein
MRSDKRCPEMVAELRAFRYGLIFSVFAWTIIVLVLHCLASCSAAPKPALPGPLADVDQVSIEEALSPSLLDRVAAMLEDTPPMLGRVAILAQRTVCRPSSGINPLILPDDRPPSVGTPWACTFLTSACPMPPEPDRDCWLLISLRPPGPGFPIDFSAFGMPGCWLQVNLDMLVPILRGFEAPAGALLTRDPGRGRINLRWVPAPGTAGQDVWMQLLVSAPGETPSGFVASAAMQITVGT